MADKVLTAELFGNGQNFQNWGKKCKKNGTLRPTVEPRYNGFCVISDRVITQLQCIFVA